MSRKVLIVGGVAGGASTAARLRRVDETAEIIMFEKGEYISFANCGLPYYIGGVIEERDALLVQTPEAMNSRFNIDVRVQNEVLSIDREAKTVSVKNLATGETYEESYDVLVLSPGSTPLKPPIPGIDAPNIFTLWNIPDTDRIKAYVDEKKPKTAVVIGGGFIGIEMAENLVERDVEVSLVEMQNQVMAPIDFEMAQVVHQHMKSHGMNLHLSDGVKEFEYKDGVTTVVLQSGTRIEADMVMLSIGVKAQSDIAKEAGLEVNQRGGIVVDKKMVTSDPNIYAIGDAIEVEDFILGDKTMIPLAGPANKQGRIAANNIVGISDVYKGTQGTSIAKVFDITVANTGLNEKILQRQGKKFNEDYMVSITHSKSNAGYYPGAIPMTIKLIFAKKDGKVLGAQVVGYDGSDKRLDVIATAIRFGGTIYDLKELELAYAPPFSSAKDPVNMAGFVAENMLEDKCGNISWNEMDDLDMEKTVILDVREPEERTMGFIAGSMNIPVDSLRDRMDELPKDKKIVIYCAVGLRGYVASRILLQNGFEDVVNFSGGYTTYSCVFCQDEDEKCGGFSCDPNVDFSESGDVEAVHFDENSEEGEVIKLNACGLQCPGPIMQVFQAMEIMNPGDFLEVRATDPGFVNDIGTWAKSTGNTLIDAKKDGKEFKAKLRKGKPLSAKKTSVMAEIPNDKTMVVFSGDLDKAIASLIIANGAASMGRQVTMFYTFWGLNILRKHEKVNVKKDAMAKMFSAMMPRGTKRLGLSRMNFGGMGAKMIRGVMKKHNVDSLEQLMKTAQENGVRMIACNMSMDLMGITEEELIDGIDFGGVASYLGAAEEADVNLFI